MLSILKILNIDVPSVFPKYLHVLSPMAHGFFRV